MIVSGPDAELAKRRMLRTVRMMSLRLNELQEGSVS